MAQMMMQNMPQGYLHVKADGDDNGDDDEQPMCTLLLRPWVVPLFLSANGLCFFCCFFVVFFLFLFLCLVDDLGVTHDDDKKKPSDGDDLSFNSADFEKTE